MCEVSLNTGYAARDQLGCGLSIYTVDIISVAAIESWRLVSGLRSEKTVAQGH